MSKLLLEFSSQTTPELLSTQFSSHLLNERAISLRGKLAGDFQGKGSFQWTSAVQALSIFFLRSKALPASAPALCGEKKSAASSLDFAIAKPPLWLIEMFGADSKGDCLIRRAVKRSNPEQKRLGPVSISLNQNFLSKEDISILVCGLELKDPQELIDLAVRIENKHFGKPLSTAVVVKKNSVDLTFVSEPRAKLNSFVSEQEKLGVLPWPFSEPTQRRFWHDEFRREIKRALCGLNIFNRSSYRKDLQRLVNSQSFQTRSLGNTDSLARMDVAIEHGERLGLLGQDDCKKLSEGAPINFWFPSVQPATMALYNYLKVVKELPMRGNYIFPNAVKIVEKLDAAEFVNPPEVCSLGVAPAAELLSRGKGCEYIPVLLMPQLSHRIQCSKSKQNKGVNYGEYFFFSESPTTSTFYFDDLVRRNEISVRKVSVNHAEPDELLGLLNDEKSDARVLFWFPHYNVSSLYSDSSFLDLPNAPSSLQDVILFFHKDFYASARSELLLKAIRDAWLELKLKEENLDIAVEAIIEDREHSNYFSRYTGLHSLVS